MESHAPASSFRRVRRESRGDMVAHMESRVEHAMAVPEVRTLVRPSLIAVWWSPMHKGVDSMRLSVRMAVQAADAWWRMAADSVGRTIPIPAFLTGRERRVRRVGGITVGVVPPRRLGRKTVRRASSMGSNWVEIASTTR